MQVILLWSGLIASVSCLPALGKFKKSEVSSRGIHLPIHVTRTKPQRRLVTRDEGKGSVWLVDYKDLIYNVLVNVGTVQTPLVLDTGSSDLWLLSDGCQNGCGTHNVSLFPMNELDYSGSDARLLYGDSKTGTHAFGPIGSTNMSLAGIQIDRQYFAAINDTNTSVTVSGSAGIFGLGFPINSAIFNELYEARMDKESGVQPANPDGVNQRREERDPGQNHLVSSFPTLPGRLARLRSSSSISARQDGGKLGTVKDVLNSFSSIGPLVSRMAQEGNLDSPQATVTLQRNSIDVGGNYGVLSLGSLPEGIKNETLTWVPVRNYTAAEGGLPPPLDSPDEVYPIAWEAHIEAVFLDGVKLPKSNLSNPRITTTALIDTGNSLIRGPKDVVNEIYQRIGATPQGMISCNTPHTLAYQIGGKLFKMDPRDFLAPAKENGLDACWPNIVSTDPPSTGFLYSWSFGDPFLKSTLASFYYGNLTYPSKDPPRIGFLSTVPDNADDLFRQAVADAQVNSNQFPVLIAPAPAGKPLGQVGYGAGAPTNIKVAETASPTVSMLAPLVSSPPNNDATTLTSAPTSTPSQAKGAAFRYSFGLHLSIGITSFLCTLLFFW